MIHARLVNGLLSDIRQGEKVFPEDVELSAMPLDNGPWTYDAVNQLAVPVPPPTPAEILVALIAFAKLAFDDADPLLDAESRRLRAILILIMEENNILRTRLRAQDAVVAGASNLANLKSAWATMATANPVPDRNASQIKPAVRNKLDEEV